MAGGVLEVAGSVGDGAGVAMSGGFSVSEATPAHDLAPRSTVRPAE